MDTPTFLKAFLGLFAMMNPIGNAGIFISMTGGLPASFVLRSSIKVTIYVMIILVGAAFGGTAILDAFGISLPAFQLAGGLIVLGIGFKMLGGGENESHHTDAGKSTLDDVSGKEREVDGSLMVPLAMPILAGPGSITTVVTAAAAVPTMSGRIGAAAGAAALTIVLGLCFALTSVLGRFITPNVQQIVLRFMGLILIAIAADMMLTGFQQSFGEGAKNIVPALVDEVEESMKRDAATPAKGAETR
jgi:multiple antibiotic resistance protein